ncbi:unnamed protein product [Paramecium pentaurelia]|uniref:Tubulin-tyrosine ligase family protein n=1 Tax=Paramecium pentaurelia TaxID=43138 RepID=A0A8S1XVM7_9CILI|nr:unnamed protein product [Paramecium pentaurelia]
MQQESELEDFSIDWSQVIKPKLSEKRIKKKEIKQDIQTKVNVFDKISICFRYRIATLITQLGKPQYYCKFDPKLKKTIQSNNKQKKKLEEQLSKIATQLELSCRFITRSMFQITRQPLLKSMKIDIRSILNKAMNDKEFQKLYLDLDDQSEEQRKKEEETEKILAQIQPLSESEVREGIEKLRKKHNLNQNQYLYVIQGEYFNDMKNLFNSLGWVEIEDVYTQIYDFKFCYLKKFLHKPIPEQVVSRFASAKLLTTKFGLARSLKSCYILGGVDSNTFFPRCYDLSDENDFEDFLEEYKFTFAENYLKKNPKDEEKINIAIEILNYKLMPIQDKINRITCEDYPICTPQQWQILYKKSEPKQEIIQFNNPNIMESIKNILQNLSDIDPQYKISKGENIWVTKPCGLSRGRGVKYFKELEDILAYTFGAKDVNFVAQKCLENIMTIQKRKFDIRQWIIVSDVQPLTIWMYKECYIRFCGVEYNTDDLKNRYAHLTNFSVQKQNEDNQEEKLMMTQEEFSQIIKERGFDFEREVREKFKNIIIATMKSCKKSFEIRKNTFEVFGLDFIVDDDCNPWLIEVNASPTFAFSTPVTERLNKMGLTDLGHFIVEYIYNKTKKKNYGGWELIYKQKL